MEIEDEDEDSGEGLYGSSDEEEGDDDSWKVRRSAIKLISTMFVARQDLWRKLSNETLAQLITRLEESDSAVKLDTLVAFRALINTIVVSHEEIPLLAPQASMNLALAGPPPLVRMKSQVAEMEQ